MEECNVSNVRVAGNGRPVSREIWLLNAEGKVHGN